MAQRFFLPIEQVFTNLGAVGAGYKLGFFETNTTTPKDTYSDTALSVPNTNPIIADANGRYGDIFVENLADYKVTLRDESDNLIWTADPSDPKAFTLNDFDPRPASFWGTTAGSSTAYNLAADPSISANSNKHIFLLQMHATSGASPTLDIDGQGALSLKKYNTQTSSKLDIVTNDLLVGRRYWVTNDGTDYIVLNPEETFINIIDVITVANNGIDSDRDIDFSAGTFIFDDNSGRAVASALTKQIDNTWTEGSNQGGLDTGTVAADTTYYMFAIYNPTTSTADFLFSTSVSSPALPSGYTKKKKIAILVTDGSANIRSGLYKFYNAGGYEFEYDDGGTLDSTTSPGTGSRTLYGLSVPPSVKAKFVIRTTSSVSAAGTKRLFITNPDATDQNSIPSIEWFQGNAADVIYSQIILKDTDSFSRIGIRANNTGIGIIIYTKGWSDNNL